MFRIWQHGHENIGVLGNFPHLLPEGDSVLEGLGCLGVVDVEGEDLVASLG
jgi:hypothetical protein